MSIAVGPRGGVVATGYAFETVCGHDRDGQTARQDRGIGYVIALAASGRVRWIRRLVVNGPEAYVLPLGAHITNDGSIHVVCLGHGSVREAEEKAPMLRLTTGHFQVTYTQAGSL